MHTVYILMKCPKFFNNVHILISWILGRYDSGDHVAVYPTNDAAVVKRIGERLGVDLDTVISLKNLDGMY